jgi:hypothetical protein
MLQTVKKVRSLEGQAVAVALVDGFHIDACRLVSVTGGGEGTLWLLDDDVDLFVRLVEVTDLMPLPAIGGWAA